MRFRTWLETNDIFGFDAHHAKEKPDDDLTAQPIHQFDLEHMIELLLKKPIHTTQPLSHFMNEIQWGSQPGALKLEVDTGFTFHIKQLGVDRQGNPRWVSKQMLQLNREGYGGQEDSVAQEIFNHIEKFAEHNIESPKESYSENELENLVQHIFNKLKRTSKVIFLPVGIKKLGEYAYVISMEVRGHGLESPGHHRVEQNQTLVSYDKDQGTIRITNYNIESPTGGRREWAIQPNDLDLYFFPTQDRDEISECLAVHMKYY